MSKRLRVADGGTGALIAGDVNTGAPLEVYRSLLRDPAAAPGHCAACHAVRMLVHHLLLVTTEHFMAAGFLQTVRRAVVAFLAMVFGVGLLAGGLLGFFVGRAVGRRG